MINSDDIKLEIPKSANFIISKLKENGFEGFIVGGCVRDLLLKTTPKDFDITTNAKPEDVKKIFYKTIDTGIEHGTVTVRVFGESFEVTTYRIDGEYLDNRHPKNVTFSSDLKEDLSRRDFTINAMAYSKESGLVDLFEGRGDLQKKVIRAVGDPIKRFEEDALRILRALRFSARFGYEIENETLKAINKLENNLDNISKERIRVELEGILTSDNPWKLMEIKNSNLFRDLLTMGNKDFTDKDIEERLINLKNLPKDISVIYSYLLNNNYEISDDKLFTKGIRFLKYDNKTTKEVKILSTAKYFNIETNIYEVRKQLAFIGKDLVDNFISLKKMYLESNDEIKRFDKEIKLIRKVLKRNNPLFVRDLKINGDDIKEKFGLTDKEIGDALRECLDKCMQNPRMNTKRKLLKWYKNKLMRGNL